MIILIAGATHTGKTILVQRLLEKYKYPYLSIDHLKMGLIRSRNTQLTVNDDTALLPYLWNIVKEIIKTALENGQNMIIEGCYIPFEWKKDFSKHYLENIDYYCLIMTDKYIGNHFEDILGFADIIEKRIDTSPLEKDKLLEENKFNLKQCKKYRYKYILIDEDYKVDIRQFKAK